MIQNSNILTRMVIIEEQFALGIEFISTQDAHRCTLVNIYGPCQGEQRDNFTKWLFDLDIPSSGDWLLLRDFNYIRAPKNHNLPGRYIHDLFTFNGFIREQELTELPIKGRAYTWSNMQQNPLLKQLDWFCTKLNWTTSFPNTW